VGIRTSKFNTEFAFEGYHQGGGPCGEGLAWWLFLSGFRLGTLEPCGPDASNDPRDHVSGYGERG
jgi:hypothetical protein